MRAIFFLLLAWASTHAAATTSTPIPRLAAEAAAADQNDLVLKAGVFDPLTEQPKSAWLTQETLSRRHGIVQFVVGVVPDAAIIEAAGGKVVDLVPHRAFIVRGNEAVLARLAAHPSIRYAGPLRASHKISPLLVKGAKSVYQDISVEIIGFPGQPLEGLRRLAQKLLSGGEIFYASEATGRPWLRITVEREAFALALPELARAEQVFFIDQFMHLSVENADSVGVVQANADSGGLPPTNTPIWDRGIIGSGQIVAVVDSGVDRNQSFFSQLDRGDGPNLAYTDGSHTIPPMPGPVYPDRKIYGYFVQPGASEFDDAEDCSGRGFFHGTHVAGSVAGDGGTPSTPTEANYDEGDGMAPNAQILAVDIGNDETGCLSGATGPETYEQAVRAGAFIASNSFGSPVTDDDGVVDAALIYAGSDFNADFITRRFEDLLFVKSAGNDGDVGAMTLSHPAYSKNGLVVAALEHGNDPAVAGFSSRGPTFDGRIKPDIGAPGVGIRSAAGNDLDAVPPPLFGQNAISTKSGTSMATPTVSGSAALARQYFTDGFYPTGRRNPDNALIPSGSLLKAVLLNGTRLYADTPAFDSGWGRVWLDNNLYFPGDNRDLRVWDLPNLSGLRTGEIHEYDVEVPAGAPFRATLVWYDPPGSLFTAGPVLVNDLNLVVTTGSQTFRGNQIRQGASRPGGGFDSLNTVEQVILPTPDAGTYTLRVRGDAVPGNGAPNSARQGYALVVSSAQCSTGVDAAPGITLSDTSSALDLAIDGVAGASGYQVYRAQGACDAPLGEFDFVGATTSASFSDTTTQGGFEYAYRVRGVDACGEGPISVCRTAVSQAACTLPPEFDADTVTVTRIGGDDCGVEVRWSAGETSCPETELRYTIYRSTSPFFEPRSENVIASDVSGTSYIDLAVDPLTTYYYVVRAEDTAGAGQGPNNGNESLETIRYRITTFADGNEPGVFVDDPDVLSLVDTELPWQIQRGRAATGNLAYLNAAPAELYPPDTCAHLTTPPIDVQAGAVLSYDARYHLESNWDGVVVEISNDGGQTWDDLPPAGGYPSDFSSTSPNGTPVNACGFQPTRRAFNGETNAFRNYTSDLGAFAGQQVQIRWTFSSDPGLEFEGFFLDNISVSNSSRPLACTVVEQTPELTVSGPWFTPDQGGHGWFLEQLAPLGGKGANLLNAYWYVYRDGLPVWLIGLGELAEGHADLDVFITSGAEFPPAFDPEAVQLDPWGTLSFDFDGEGGGMVSWNSIVEGFGDGSQAISQLATIADSAAACQSGSYYNVDQNGHGFVAQVLEVGGETQVLLAWYVYLGGQQVWLLGQAALVDGRAEVPMSQFAGAAFPPAFDSADVVSESWGTVIIDFTGPDSAEVSWTSDVEGYGDGALSLIRLTTLDGHACGS